jgi:septum formation inhibitor-activating ATPase MinD
MKFVLNGLNLVFLQQKMYRFSISSKDLEFLVKGEKISSENIHQNLNIPIIPIIFSLFTVLVHYNEHYTNAMQNKVIKAHQQYKNYYFEYFYYKIIL